jgi:hypothetical protein
LHRVARLSNAFAIKSVCVSGHQRVTFIFVKGCTLRRIVRETQSVSNFIQCCQTDSFENAINGCSDARSLTTPASLPE